MKDKKNKNNLIIRINVSNSFEQIYRGINDPVLSWQGLLGLKYIQREINRVRNDLNSRSNGKIPDGIVFTMEKVSFTLSRFEQWIDNQCLLNNHDAEVFLDALDLQLKELNLMLEEFSIDYN